MANWTIETISALIARNDRAVERAIIAIYNRQTADEKNDQTTRHVNNVGFSGADVRTGTYLAQWILSGKHLDGKFLAKGRTIALKYRRQLLDIANEKNTAS